MLAFFFKFLSNMMEVSFWIIRQDLFRQYKAWYDDTLPHVLRMMSGDERDVFIMMIMMHFTDATVGTSCCEICCLVAFGPVHGNPG